MPDMSGNTLLIDISKDGQRIDNFLFVKLKGVPKSHIYRLLRTGKIRVNGKRVKQTYRLQVDDTLMLPELRLSQSRIKKAKISEHVKTQIQNSILYEDEVILVINKPAGIAVHPGTGIAYGIIEIVREICPAAPYLELVHRLDRGTSGCLLIAKTKNMLSELHELLRLQKIHKEYLAVLKGEWMYGEKIINSPLINKKELANDIGGRGFKSTHKNAITKFSPTKIYREFSVMNVTIETGRTHQIRVHAAQVGYPIVGDNKYGDFSFNRKCQKMGINRMLLHAQNISFLLPKSGQKFNFTAPIDASLMAILDSLDTCE